MHNPVVTILNNCSLMQSRKKQTLNQSVEESPPLHLLIRILVALLIATTNFGEFPMLGSMPSSKNGKRK